MNIIDFFLMEQQRLHSWMRTGVSDLTVGQVPHGFSRGLVNCSAR